MMKIIDTHSHLYGDEFKDDLEDVVQRAREAGVEKILLPNINEDSIEAMMDLCRRYPGYFYPMLGLHPTDLTPDYKQVLDRMERMLVAGHPFVAIGEVGLDYYWDRTYYDEQKEVFDRQVQWALKFGLPLMIHSRSAQKELLEVLSPYREKGLTGVFHSFGGSVDEAMELLAFEGFKLGINGVLTFKKTQLPDVLKQIPLERLVLETDSPYLAPVPFRGKRNESAYIVHTLRKMAEIYDCDPEKVALQTFTNALEVFPKAR